jgi:hypothetical protein
VSQVLGGTCCLHYHLYSSSQRNLLSPLSQVSQLSEEPAVSFITYMCPKFQGNLLSQLSFMYVQSSMGTCCHHYHMCPNL